MYFHHSSRKHAEDDLSFKEHQISGMGCLNLIIHIIIFISSLINSFRFSFLVGVIMSSLYMTNIKKCYIIGISNYFYHSGNLLQKLLTGMTPTGGKPLRRFLCCYHPKIVHGDEDTEEVIYPNTGHGTGSDGRTDEIMKSEKMVVFMDEECTYQRNESPQPDEVFDVKLNDANEASSNFFDEKSNVNVNFNSFYDLDFYGFVKTDKKEINSFANSISSSRTN